MNTSWAPVSSAQGTTAGVDEPDVDLRPLPPPPDVVSVATTRMGIPRPHGAPSPQLSSSRPSHRLSRSLIVLVNAVLRPANVSAGSGRAGTGFFFWHGSGEGSWPGPGLWKTSRLGIRSSQAPSSYSRVTCPLCWVLTRCHASRAGRPATGVRSAMFPSRSNVSSSLGAMAGAWRNSSVTAVRSTFPVRRSRSALDHLGGSPGRAETAAPMSCR